MDPAYVEIVPLGPLDPMLPAALAAQIPTVFGLPCTTGRPEALPAAAFDAGRGQYSARALIDHLARGRSTAIRRLGMTNVDLCSSIMRYVFGEAMLGGRCAIVSIHRLGAGGANPAGLDKTHLLARAVKEGIHELGHTFDLVHCDDPKCVMAASSDVAHVDAKSFVPCGYCRIALADGLARPAGIRRNGGR